MAQEQLIHGIIAYPITPFDEDGIDVDRLAGLVDAMVDAGVHAIAPLGSTGESAYLTFDEWKAVVDATVRPSPGACPWSWGHRTSPPPERWPEPSTPSRPALRR
jgi:4-hydroxy-tetrahydrodipicolinate synthase